MRTLVPSRDRPGVPLPRLIRMDTTYQGNIVQSPAAWSAVVSMALCMTSPGASSERPHPSAGEHGSPGPLDLSIGDFPTNEKIVYWPAD